MRKIKSIRLDLSTNCQLKCTICPTANGELRDTIGYGYLKFMHFKKIVASNPLVKNIELSNYGEIFLNPEIDQILEYSFRKKISLSACNGCNFNTVSEQTLENLVKYGFKKISISIDGCDPETYSIYRKKGKFYDVINNIEKLNDYKKKYRSKYPKLRWQSTVSGHNQHQISDAKEYAKKLNMDFMLRPNWDTSYSPIHNAESKTIAKRDSKKRRELFNYSVYMCSQLWHMPQINWDGKLLGCCINFWGDYGNVIETSLEECMNGESYKASKAMLLGRQNRNYATPCFYCSVYKNLTPKKRMKLIFYILYFITVQNHLNIGHWV